MPLITQSDLSTHMYPEIITEISRSDNTIVSKAIDTAIQETKMYLSRYDLLQLFGNDTTDPTIQDEFLKSLVKDIACWHLLRLANPGIDYTVFRTAYEDAITTLKAIMSAATNPQDWPYYDATNESTPTGDTINWSSNPKRINYY